MLDMSIVIDRRAMPYTIKSVTVAKVDFVKTETVTSRIQNCVIQPADKDKLIAGSIDWSLDYIMIHSADDISNGEYISYNAIDYKVISKGGYNAYGYVEVIAEQTRKAPK